MSEQGKHLRAAEYQELVDKDQILQFMERVNKRAINDPTWNQNYALALYQAFGKESRSHLRKLGVASIETTVPVLPPS